MNLELDLKKINNLSENLKDICNDCNGYNKFCLECPVNFSIKELSKFVDLEYYSNEIITEINIYDLNLDKNKVFLVQNSLEDICSDCNFIGIYCKKCSIHKIKREISSLPLKNITISYDFSNKKIEKSSCGSSCSSSCSTR